MEQEGETGPNVIGQKKPAMVFILGVIFMSLILVLFMFGGGADYLLVAIMIIVFVVVLLTVSLKLSSALNTKGHFEMTLSIPETGTGWKFEKFKDRLAKDMVKKFEDEGHNFSWTEDTSASGNLDKCIMTFDLQALMKVKAEVGAEDGEICLVQFVFGPINQMNQGLAQGVVDILEGELAELHRELKGC